MNAETESRLSRLAVVFVAHDVFPDVPSAYRRLHRDYPRGYPNDVFIDGVLEADADGRLLEVDLDSHGNYSYLAEKR